MLQDLGVSFNDTSNPLPTRFRNLIAPILFDINLLEKPTEKLSRIAEAIHTNIVRYFEDEESGIPMPKYFRPFLPELLPLISPEITETIQDTLLTLDINELDTKSLAQIKQLLIYLRISKILFPDKTTQSIIDNYHDQLETKALALQNNLDEMNNFFEQLKKQAVDHQGKKTGRKTSTRLTALILSRFLSGETPLLDDKDGGWFGKDIFLAFLAFANTLPDPTDSTAEEKLNTLLTIICYYANHIYMHAETEGTLYQKLIPATILDLIELGANPDLLRDALVTANAHIGNTKNKSTHIVNVERLLLATTSDTFTREKQLTHIVAMLKNLKHSHDYAGDHTEFFSTTIRWLTKILNNRNEDAKNALAQLFTSEIGISPELNRQSLKKILAMMIQVSVNANNGKITLHTHRGYCTLLSFMAEAFFDGKNSQTWATYLVESGFFELIALRIEAIKNQLHKSRDTKDSFLPDIQSIQSIKLILHTILPNNFQLLVDSHGQNILEILMNSKIPCSYTIGVLTELYRSSDLLPNRGTADGESLSIFQPDLKKADLDNITEWLFYRHRIENDLIDKDYMEAIKTVNWDDTRLLKSLITACMALEGLTSEEKSAVIIRLSRYRLYNDNRFEKVLKARCKDPELEDDCEALSLYSAFLFGYSGKIDVQANHEKKFAPEWTPPDTNLLGNLTLDGLNVAAESAKIEWAPKSPFKKNTRFDRWENTFDHEDLKVRLLGLLLDTESSNHHNGRKALLLKHIFRTLQGIGDNIEVASHDSIQSAEVAELASWEPRDNDETERMIENAIHYLCEELMNQFDDTAPANTEAGTMLECLNVVLQGNTNEHVIALKERLQRCAPANTTLSDVVAARALTNGAGTFAAGQGWQNDGPSTSERASRVGNLTFRSGNDDL